MSINFEMSPQLKQQPTRGLWYVLGTCHDFESKRLQTSVFGAHQAQLAIIFLWTSFPIFQVAWQGNYESWIANPTITPIAHTIRDPQFGSTAATTFSAVIVSTPGVYEWYYTIGLRTVDELFVAGSFLVTISMLLLVAAIIHVASASTFHIDQARLLGAGDSTINHHLGGFLGSSSIAWAGHLVHVAIPRSRGQAPSWENILTQLAHPDGLRPFTTLNWAAYSKQPDQWNHVFGVADGAAGTSVLTFLGSRMPSSDSLWLTDVSHHHLALGIVLVFLSNFARTLTLNGEQYRLHWYLALSLVTLGTASSFAANHIDAFTVYAYLAKDFTAMSAITLFLGFHTLGLYVHNDVMQAFGAPELEISLSLVFGQWLQISHGILA